MYQIPSRLHKRLVRWFTLLEGILVTTKQKHATLREVSASFINIALSYDVP